MTGSGHADFAGCHALISFEAACFPQDSKANTEDQEDGAHNSRMKQQNQLEAPGLFVKPLCQAVPHVYSRDNHPERTDSISELSDIKGNQILSTAFCRSEQRRAPAARPNTKIPCCKEARLEGAKA